MSTSQPCWSSSPQTACSSAAIRSKSERLFTSRNETPSGSRVSLRAMSATGAITIVSGLGTTSAYLWLKLPVVDDLDRVMRATTLPTLLLGGDPDDDPKATFASWQRAMAIPQVRGLVAGRTLLYPKDGDVARAVDAAAAIVAEKAKS